MNDRCVQIDKSTTTSTLSLNKLGAVNAGKYSCQPAMLDAATVDLYVLDDDGNQVPLTNSGDGGDSLSNRLLMASAVLVLSTPLHHMFAPFLMLV